MKNALTLAILAIGAAALVSWKGEPSPETGAVIGQVTARGTTSPAPLRVTKDVEHCGTQLPSEAIVVGQGGALRNAVVSIEGVREVPVVKPRDLVLRNERCAFRPRVQAGMVGSPLTLTNSDPMLHNVNLSLVTAGRGRSILNLAMPGRLPRLNASRATRTPGHVKAKCDAHEWMSAHILLFDHPFYGVTDATGSFSISRVPPGTYVVRVWHESLGELTKVVTVEAGRSTRIAFTFGG